MLSSPVRPPAHAPPELHGPPAQSLAVRLGWGLLMVLSQLVLWALAAAIALPEALLLTFVWPVPALAIAALRYRPGTPVPVGAEATDWGETLGYAWVQVGARTHWVQPGIVAALRTARPPTPLELETTLDGFRLSVPSPASGIPAVWTLVARSLAALLVPAGVLAVLAAVLTLAESGDPVPALFVLVFGMGASTLLYTVLLAPWAALLWVALGFRVGIDGGPTQVSLSGRRVRVGGDDFLLGSPGQRLELDGQTLTLRNDHQHVVIRGSAAALAWLHRTFERLERDEAGDAEDVPRALRALQRSERH